MKFEKAVSGILGSNAECSKLNASLILDISNTRHWRFFYNNK